MAEVTFDKQVGFNDLNTWISTLTELKDYTIQIDCSGIVEQDLKTIGNKLNSAKNGIFFKVYLINIDDTINDFSNGFDNCSKLREIYIDTPCNITNASRLFYQCSNLQKASILGLSKTTDVSYMFYYCSQLSSINWGAIKPTSISSTFNGASTTKSISVSDPETKAWFTTNASSMSLNYYYFSDSTSKITLKYNELDTEIPKLESTYLYDLTIDCKGVTEDQFYGDPWNASPLSKKLQLAKKNVFINLKLINIDFILTKATSMFRGCSSLTEIDTQYFTNVTYAGSMFFYCSKLTHIDTQAFTNVTDAYGMFTGCSSLTQVDTKAFTNVTNAGVMFDGCSSLTHIDTQAFTNVTDASYMFHDCSSLTEIDTQAFTNVTDASNMFSDSGLTQITGTQAFTNVTNAYWMFRGCSSLTQIDTQAFTNVTNAISMFSGCSGLTQITGTSAFTNVTNASDMFTSCSSLTEIDTKAFTNVINAESMFQYCSKLTQIDTQAFTNVTYAYEMFEGCSSLPYIDTQAFTNVTNASWMFHDCSSLTEIDTQAFTNVTDASYMFTSCSKLIQIDTKAFTNVTDASYMFKGCSSLTEITGTQAFTKVTNASYMFEGCSGLTQITGTQAFTNVTEAQYMFYGCRGLTKITWGSMKPTQSGQMLNTGCSGAIIVEDEKTKDYIQKNINTYKYAVIVGSAIITTLETLENDISILTNGIHNICIRELGISRDTVVGSSSNNEMSILGNKLSSAPMGVMFNLSLILPDFQKSLESCFNSTSKQIPIKSLQIINGENLSNIEGLLKNNTSIENVEIGWANDIENSDFAFQNCTNLKSVDTGVHQDYTPNTFRNIPGNVSIKVSDDKTKTWLEQNDTNIGLTKGTYITEVVGYRPFDKIKVDTTFANLANAIKDYPENTTLKVNIDCTDVENIKNSNIQNTLGAKHTYYISLLNINKENCVQYDTFSHYYNIVSITIDTNVSLNVTEICYYCENLKAVTLKSSVPTSWNEISDYGSSLDISGLAEGSTISNPYFRNSLEYINFGNFNDNNSINSLIYKVNKNKKFIAEVSNKKTGLFVKKALKQYNITNYSIVGLGDGSLIPSIIPYKELDIYSGAYDEPNYHLTIDFGDMTQTDYNSSSTKLGSILGKETDSSFKLTLSIPDTISDINGILNNSKNITSLNLGSSKNIRSIRNAFENSSLTEIELPNLPNDADVVNAFNGCSSISFKKSSPVQHLWLERNKANMGLMDYTIESYYVVYFKKLKTRDTELVLSDGTHNITIPEKDFKRVQTLEGAVKLPKEMDASKLGVVGKPEVKIEIKEITEVFK